MMPSPTPASLPFRKRSFLLAGLFMAIGWGIRGNFGHQYGAAFAGCLGAIAVCLLSGREDWRAKLLYFGFFGAIGWGFGATVSYMQVIAYAESGQAATQWYGYACLYVIGFLWACMGAAGTAFAAAADNEKLEKLFKVVLWVFAAWIVQDVCEDTISRLLQPSALFDGTASRQRNPLYWFDANYLPACFALLGVCGYDIYERRGKHLLYLPLFALLGALAGWLVQAGLRSAGWEQRLGEALTFRLGDLRYTDPTTGLPAYHAEDLLTNWPQWFNDHSGAIGWFTGLIGGVIFYFKRFGRFRHGASLIVYMAAGWLVFFIVFPVLGSLLFKQVGGIRMTPPRSDDWAGIAGVVAGTLLWFKRNGYLSVATASVISGAIGGLGFSGIEWIKQLMMAPGNPRIAAANGISADSVERWAAWQHQNWHSFLEQSYGFVNGIALAVGVWMLVRRLPANIEQPLQGSVSRSNRWIAGACTMFILLIVPYVNLIKNVDEWTKSLKPEIWTTTVTTAQGATETVPALWDVPYLGRLPGVHALHLSAEAWFNLTWILLAIAVAGLLRQHFRQRLTVVPATWIGKGQLILLSLLWLMVIGNFERALPQWSPSRLLTEWVITVDAVIATYLILLLPQQRQYTPVGLVPAHSFQRDYRKAWIVTVGGMLVLATFFLVTNRAIYRYDPNEKIDTKLHLRFGPDADWRSRPILKTAAHK